jgi:GNAT superfamily N-acetyltransferase
MHLRHAHVTDYERALAATESWWDGRPRGARLARVFFLQFAPVSFVLEADDELIGLLLGHLSQTRPDEAVVHFIGVHPEHRRLGLGRRLYERFFAAAEMQGRTVARAFTLPTDHVAVAFHLATGFTPVQGGGEVGGVPVCRDYAGRGGHRVVFRRTVSPEPVGVPSTLGKAG